MKKTYISPEIVTYLRDDADIISTSAGDTPEVNPFEW